MVVNMNKQINLIYINAITKNIIDDTTCSIASRLSFIKS